MNKQKLLELADHIEKMPHFPYRYQDPDHDDAMEKFLDGDDQHYFNMLTYIETNSVCGTVCCVAGETVRLWGHPQWAGTIVRQAADILDLDMDRAMSLFHPPERLEWGSLTPAQAAHVIRQLAETGMVAWPVMQEKSA